jgi:uncharacterized protein (TIGR03790 family)
MSIWRISGARVIALLLLIVFALSNRSPGEDLGSATIVIFNKSAPESVELAKFYAQKRGIARDHLVGLDCSANEEISREEYDASIRNPLRDVLRQRGWWTVDSTTQPPRVTASSIHFVAVIKGMPLKVRGTTGPYEGDRTGPGAVGNRNDASVDSEIAALAAWSQQISGLLPNPYFQSYRAIMDLEAPGLLLVCRLDAASTATVRQMITDAVETERNGLWGRAFVDGAHNTSGGLEVGDQWLAQIPDQLRKVGVPVVYDDTPALFPDGFPMTNCALYYGWYSGAVSGPFTQPGFRFSPGAVAVHIHSFSAATLRDPNAHWAAPLLAKGAAATLGNVYEPFLQFTTHLDIFNDRLLHGFTFAESAAMATPAFSWTCVALGDPLYRPYAAWLQLDAKRDGDKASGDWKAYHDFVTKTAGRPAPEVRARARQFASTTRNGPMIEDIGLMEMRDGNLASATNCFSQARTIYTARDDILRVALQEADAWLKQSKPKRALELVRSVSRVVTDAPAAPLLKHVEQEALGALSNAPKRK